MVRSFIEPIATLGNPATRDNLYADVLEAAMIETGIISSFASPLFVTTMLVYSNDPEFLKLDEDLQNIAHYLFYMQLSQTFLQFFVTFVPYYKFAGTTSWARYNRIMPYFHYWFLLVIFYVYPFL